MYSTTDSIMLDYRGRWSDLYPFLAELSLKLWEEIMEYQVVDENNEPVFLPDSDSESPEEYAMYPVDSCDCITINMLVDPPAFTRLQYKSQQTLIKLAEEHKLKLLELVDIMSQYMEAQKEYGGVDVPFIKEQDYIDECNSLMEHFKLENDCIKDYKRNVYIQMMRSMYLYEEMLLDCYDNLDTTNKSITNYKYQMVLLKSENLLQSGITVSKRAE